MSVLLKENRKRQIICCFDDYVRNDQTLQVLEDAQMIPFNWPTIQVSLANDHLTRFHKLYKIPLQINITVHSNSLESENRLTDVLLGIRTNGCER